MRGSGRHRKQPAHRSGRHGEQPAHRSGRHGEQPAHRSGRRTRQPARGRGVLAAVAAVLALAAGCGGEPRHLLLVVSVDTLRADRLGAYGSALSLSPRLDALAAESVVFEHAFAPTSFTLPSVGALLTGRSPDELGLRSNTAVLPAAPPTLASILWSRGWSTGAVVSNYVLRRAARLDRGFGAYDDHFSSRERVRGLPERRARATTDAALALLDAMRSERDAPILLWVHYQDPHGPYLPPAEHAAPPGPPPAGVTDRDLPFAAGNNEPGAIPRYQRLGEQRDSRAYRSRYHGEIRYADAEIGRLLEGVAERGLYDESVVVFAADHGESLGEHDHWFQHGELLDVPETRVPLWIRVPGRDPARRTDTATLLDLLPTVLAAVGVEPPPDFSGRDLLGPGASGERSALFQSTLEVADPPRRALLSDGWRYEVVLGPGDVRESLRPLGDGSEPGAPPDPARLEAFRRRLAAIEAGLAGSSPIRQELTEEERARLRALGYLDPEAEAPPSSPGAR
jgi:arylsulfatase A-like enzyme